VNGTDQPFLLKGTQRPKSTQRITDKNPVDGS
jgi:hypothetical protein